MNKILVAFGTRPEIIKLAPVIKALEASSKLEVIKLHTGQHDELAENMLDVFDIVPDHDFKIMSSVSDLFELSQVLLPKLKALLEAEKPDAVIVQGDTSSSYLSALAAFYLQIPIYHVEAGLRSFDDQDPFPEEMNRKQISALASMHFTPTSIASRNLLNEGIDQKNIHETGNTIIDALFQIKNSEEYKTARPNILDDIKDNQQLILVTSHRRENLGDPLTDIMDAMFKIVERNESSVILFPAHPNPKVREVVASKKFSHDRIKIIEPLDYLSFHYVLDRCTVVLTDSGGIQEEAAALGKAMLVLRKTTERQELVESGFTKLVGHDTQTIIRETESLLGSTKEKNLFNPYGDGTAGKKIAEIITTLLS